MTSFHEIKFIPSGRGKAQQPADPLYPLGKKVIIARPNEVSCKILLPYPAPECGLFHVRCQLCALTVCVSATGRRDDPSVLVAPCKIQIHNEEPKHDSGP